MIPNRRDGEHCLVEEVFGSLMGIGVAVRASMEIRRAMLPTFTSSHCNKDRLHEKEEICVPKKKVQARFSLILSHQSDASCHST